MLLPNGFNPVYEGKTAESKIPNEPLPPARVIKLALPRLFLCCLFLCCHVISLCLVFSVVWVPSVAHFLNAEGLIALGPAARPSHTFFVLGYSYHALDPVKGYDIIASDVPACYLLGVIAVPTEVVLAILPVVDGGNGAVLELYVPSGIAFVPVGPIFLTYRPTLSELSSETKPLQVST